MSTQIKVNYTFNAPRELVYKAITESEHLRNWWGPAGWAFEVSKFDFTPGGIFLYSQKPDDGDVMWVKFVYNEIIPLEKIVYSSYFSDEAGNAVYAPFDENWPVETLNTMTFTENEGKTTLTVVIIPLPLTENEIKTIEAAQEMIQEGFTGTFDQLAEYLKNI